MRVLISAALAALTLLATAPDPAVAQASVDRAEVRALEHTRDSLDVRIVALEQLRDLRKAEAECVTRAPRDASAAELAACFRASPAPVIAYAITYAPTYAPADGTATSAVARSLAFTGVLMLGVVGNAAFGFERDPGGYVDSWRTLDKQVHALSAATLTLTGSHAGVPPWASAVAVCGVGYLFEHSQAFDDGYVSRRDALANCAGAGAAAAIAYVTRALR